MENITIVIPIFNLWCSIEASYIKYKAANY